MISVDEKMRKDLHKSSEYRIVTIVYRNYRSVTTKRRIVPKKIWFGRTPWHPQEQWLMDAYDLGKGAERSFALKDVKAWYPGEQDVPARSGSQRETSRA